MRLPWTIKREAGAGCRIRNTDTSWLAQTMKSLEFEDGAIQIDATVVAEGLGIMPPLLLEGMAVTNLANRSEDQLNLVDTVCVNQNERLAPPRRRSSEGG